MKKWLQRIRGVPVLVFFACGGPPVRTIEPEPVPVPQEVPEAPAFTPYEVAPRVTNVLRALAREYPTVLREAGIGGSVKIWFFIDEEGNVVETVLNERIWRRLFRMMSLNM